MDLRDYVAVLRRRKWPIIASVVVVVASAMLFSFLETPVYEGAARLLIEADQPVFGNGGSSAPDAAFVQTQMQVIESQPVQALVRSSLGSAPKVSTSMVGTTSVVQVSAQSTRPRQAAATANAYVDAYLSYRRQEATDALAAASKEIQRQIDVVQKQIDALGSQLAALPSCTTASSGACSQRDALQQDRDSLVSQQVPFKQKLDQLRIDSSVGTTGTRVVTRASVPTSPVRPTPVRNSALGLGVGLIFGVILAFLFEYLDDSIKGKEGLERVARDLAVLAAIPSVPGWKDAAQSFLASVAEPTSASSEAYRALRTSIRFMAVDRPLRVIQVTSPGAGEGKTTTTANLAVALARAGERVVIVSCDLRRPRVHDFFGLSNTVGFTSVLLGEVPLSAALQEANPGRDRLWVLASGPLPPNPSELLSSGRTSEIFAGLKHHADTVLVDCPPVLPVTDAAVLSAKVDGTLLIVASGTSTGKQVVRCLETLRQVGAPLVGAVLNNARVDTAYGNSYAYYGPDRREAKLGPDASGAPDGQEPSKPGKEPATTHPEP